MTVTYKAPRKLDDEPVFVTAENVPASVCSANAGGGRVFPAQAAPNGFTALITAEKGETLNLELTDKKPEGRGVEIKREDERLGVHINGKPFAYYVYSDKFLKPYLGPVFTSGGDSFTRLDFETKEHPHQRSVIAAVGDVNGVDFWNENKDPGRQKHAGFASVSEGSAFGGFTAENVWLGGGVPFVDESRTFTFYAQGQGCRYVDLEIAFTAAYGDVVFGQTKEAGPLGIRVNEAIRADKGGIMVNSEGGSGEGECWGKNAYWCDYSGVIGGVKCGVAVFDDARNERYPTAWHIRGYGLFAANNLFFKGPLTIKKGESLAYRYRICFHEGPFDAAARFENYADPAAGV